MSIRVKEENQELMLLVLEHSISGSSMKDLQNELDMIQSGYVGRSTVWCDIFC